MIVKDLINEKKYDYNTIWVCPNIVSNSRISQSEFLRGLEFVQINSIPNFIQESEVVRAWKEDDVLCIIWRNE